MRILDQIPFEIDRDALFVAMHMEPDSDGADDVRAVAAKAAPLARPRAIYEISFIEEKAGDSVVVGPVRFASRVLRANLETVDRVFPYIATCGPELDELPIATDDFVGQFCRDAIKEMALRAAMAALHDHLRSGFGLKRLAGMNPGSGDVDVWPIEQQRELFAIFGDVRRLIGVTLTDTCLMLPNKSVSGILFASETDFATCQLCHRKNCPNRHAPFDAHLWELRFGATPDASPTNIPHAS